MAVAVPAMPQCQWSGSGRAACSILYIRIFNSKIIVKGDSVLFYFPLLLAFDVGGLGIEFCVFVAGWRHALRSEWPFIISSSSSSSKRRRTPKKHKATHS